MQLKGWHQEKGKRKKGVESALISLYRLIAGRTYVLVVVTVGFLCTCNTSEEDV